MAIGAPVRRTTSTFSSPLHFLSASSVFFLSGIGRPPRTPSSAVMTNLDSASSMRPARLSGEKPPNTTECTAPMRAQASIA